MVNTQHTYSQRHTHFRHTHFQILCDLLAEMILWNETWVKVLGSESKIQITIVTIAQMILQYCELVRVSKTLAPVDVWRPKIIRLLARRPNVVSSYAIRLFPNSLYPISQMSWHSGCFIWNFQSVREVYSVTTPMLKVAIMPPTYPKAMNDDGNDRIAIQTYSPNSTAAVFFQLIVRSLISLPLSSLAVLSIELDRERTAEPLTMDGIVSSFLFSSNPSSFDRLLNILSGGSCRCMAGESSDCAQGRYKRYILMNPKSFIIQMRSWDQAKLSSLEIADQRQAPIGQDDGVQPSPRCLIGWSTER